MRRLYFLFFLQISLIKIGIILQRQINMKNPTLLVILMTLMMLAHSSETTESARVLQAAVRSATYTKMCASYSDRDALVDAKAKTDAANNQAAMKGAFKVSGNEIFGGILGDPNGIIGGLTTEGPKLYTDFGIFVGPFALGLIITLLIWPFLCCCCCCPSCCPSKCCQKPDTEQYTKCELFWPSVVLILAFLLILIASVIGITKAGDIQSSYKAVGCSAAITFDDLLNGNTASTGNFFIGINGMVDALGSLNNNLAAVSAQMDNIKYSNTGGALRMTYDLGTAVLTDLSKVPDNTVGGSVTPFTYNHFDGTAATISSTFPTFLGTADTTSPSGALNVSYYVFNQINEGLKTVGDGAQTFSTAFSGGTLSGVITQLSDSMSGIADLVSGFDGSFSTIDDAVSPIMKIVTLAVTAVFGVFIGFAALGIVGTLLMTCCQKFSCRYLLYFLCVILVVLGILTFLLSFLFSIITPILYLGCDFLTVSISSSAGFTANLGNAIGGQFSSYLSVCLPGGTGDIINQLQGVDLSAINGLNDVISSLNTFDATAIQTASQSALTTLQDSIDKYYFTDEFDFSSSVDVNFMAKIANPANYPSCTATGFTADSWIPSIRQTTIPCRGSVATTATDSDCLNSAAVSGRTGTCLGCMDTTKIIPNTGGNFVADITSRYSGCATYISDVTNLYTEYYLHKYNNINAVKSRMDAVVTLSNSGGSSFNDGIADVGTAFTNAKNALTTAVATVIDPQNGLIAGLNCLLLGEDINLIANTACNKLFNTFYFLRLTLGIAAFGILFSLCCTTCSGVRAFKHSTRKGAVLPKELGDNHESTMAALNHPK